MSALPLFVATCPLPPPLLDTILAFCRERLPRRQVLAAGSGQVLATSYGQRLDEMWKQLAAIGTWEVFYDVQLTRRVGPLTSFPTLNQPFMTFYAVRRPFWGIKSLVDDAAPYLADGCFGWFDCCTLKYVNHELRVVDFTVHNTLLPKETVVPSQWTSKSIFPAGCYKQYNHPTFPSFCTQLPSQPVFSQSGRYYYKYDLQDQQHPNLIYDASTHQPIGTLPDLNWMWQGDAYLVTADNHILRVVNRQGHSIEKINFRKGTTIKINDNATKYVAAINHANGTTTIYF